MRLLHLLRCRCASFVVVLGLAAVFAFPAPLRSSEANPDRSEATAPATALFSQIVVVGASVGAGFDSSQPFGGPKALQYRFSNFIEAALAVAHQPVSTEASALLFLNPREVLEEKITAALAAKPSLVIALDTLFWFCYGNGLNAEQRLARFEVGLKQLERIDVPIVVGDIPDASRAVGRILSRNEVPGPDVLAKCNERLRQWAAGRKNVVLFSLSGLMAKAAADEELTIGKFKWERGQSKALLRGDLLHPSRHGLAALAIGVLEAAMTVVPGIPATAVHDNLDDVYARATAAGDAQIAKQPAPAAPAGPRPPSELTLPR